MTQASKANGLARIGYPRGFHWCTC